MFLYFTNLKVILILVFIMSATSLYYILILRILKIYLQQNISMMIFKAMKVFDSLASVFSTSWMIAGSVYVYGKWSIVTWEETANSGNQNTTTTDATTDVTDLTYCDYTTYIFAFVVITIGYISLCFSVLAALCTCFCRGSDSEDE